MCKGRNKTSSFTSDGLSPARNIMISEPGKHRKKATDYVPSSQEVRDVFAELDDITSGTNFQVTAGLENHIKPGIMASS